ncbi:MAG TPA: phosphate ABC transporter permease subunit PstC [Bacteroidia bacterium]|nr:phosphate ABC transporter permease subunit PstC [Bacteroidia bacterium]
MFSVKHFKERLIEGILFLSGSITSISVVLIVLFLFAEGFRLFNKSTIEEGYLLGVNKSNPVQTLTKAQVKAIFDSEITNWKELGGRDEEIVLFRMEDITNYYSDEEIGDEFQYLPARISELVGKTPGILAFIAEKYKDPAFAGVEVHIDKLSISEFLTGREWFPTAQPVAQLGILPLILGTVWVSLGAIIIALPFGLATAIYMAEIADERVRKVLKPMVELLAGIPSVVYGFFGLIVIVPKIQHLFNIPVGETGLAGSIILGIMALPTIITITEDAIRTTPRSMKEASLALGATNWQTIYKVILPYSVSGISAAIILGIGRAMGETMAVLMVTGNAAVIPTTLLEPVRTIPATIAAELGEAPQGGLHYEALFVLGCILFLMTMILNLAVEYILSKRKRAS